MLRGLASRLEAHHQVSYTEEAIAAAVALSVQHIPDRHLPDKALDLLDEAGSRARIAAFAARATSLEPQQGDRHLELTQVPPRRALPVPAVPDRCVCALWMQLCPRHLHA